MGNERLLSNFLDFPGAESFFCLDPDPNRGSGSVEF